MSKPWIERTLFTECQSVTIMPDDEYTAIVLKSKELDGDKQEFRLYLSYAEAMTLANQLLDYVEEMQCRS